MPWSVLLGVRVHGDGALVTVVAGGLVEGVDVREEGVSSLAVLTGADDRCGHRLLHDLAAGAGRQAVVVVGLLAVVDLWVVVDLGAVGALRVDPGRVGHGSPRGRGCAGGGGSASVRGRAADRAVVG